MPLPLKYNVRHVLRRWKTTSMTVFSISLVVAMFIAVMALANGLSEAFATSGDPQNLLVLRDGATSESVSTIDRNQFNEARFLDGIAKSADGEPLIALESLNIVSLPKIGGGRSNAIIRGVGPKSMELRRMVTLAEGRMPERGLNELVVGTGASRRFEGVAIGSTVKLVKSEWKVVGRFDGGQTAFDSEFWGDAEQLNREFERTVFSSMLVRAATLESVPALAEAFGANEKLGRVKARPESDYYQEQTKSSAPIQFMGFMISGIMAFGAVFAAMNAMYASVSSRGQEVATLRAIGFSRRSILLSFTFESLITGIIAGAIGGILSLPVNGISTGTTSFTTFSEVAFFFRVTPGLIAGGIIFASAICVIGGFIPALQASRQSITDGLRG